MSTLVTARILDLAGNVYSNAQVEASYLSNIPAGTGTGPPLVGTSPFQTFTVSETDSFGNLVMTLTDLAVITPAGGSWSFSVLNSARTIGFNMTTQLVTGVSVDLTAQFAAASAPLNPGTGFGNITVTGILDTGNATIQGQLFLADGSAPSPAATFTSDPDTGLYHIGPNRMGVALGGANAVDFQTTVTKFNSGPVSAATGFQVNSAAASNLALIGNGTNFVPTAIAQGNVTNGYVDLSTNQTVAGNKTLTGNLVATTGQNQIQAFNFDSVLWVDGIKYTTLAAAYADLPSTGGTVHVPPNYSETLAANLVMSKNNAGFVFEGPATITMGTNKLVINQGVNGAFVLGLSELGGNPLGGAGLATNTGVQFKYTGSSNAFEILCAQASPAISALRIENISIDTSGGGGTAIGMNLSNVHGGFCLRHIFFNGSGAASTQTGLQLNQGGNFTGDGIIEDCWFANLKVGIDALGGGGGAVQEIVFINNIFFGGAASSTAYQFGTTFGNFIFGSTISAWTTALSVGAASTGNEFHFNSNTTTTDVAFIAGSSSNTVYYTMNVPPVVTDAGTNNTIVWSGVVGLYNEQGPTTALTGNSTDQTVYTYTLPANAMQPGKGIRVRYWANHNAGAVATTHKVFFGATAYFNNTGPAGTGQVYAEAIIFNNSGSTSAQHGSTISAADGLTTAPFTGLTSAIATAAPVIIKATFNAPNTVQLTGGQFIVEPYR